MFIVSPCWVGGERESSIGYSEQHAIETVGTCVTSHGPPRRSTAPEVTPSRFPHESRAARRVSGGGISRRARRSHEVHEGTAKTLMGTPAHGPTRLDAHPCGWSCSCFLRDSSGELHALHEMPFTRAAIEGRHPGGYRFGNMATNRPFRSATGADRRNGFTSPCRSYAPRM